MLRFWSLPDKSPLDPDCFIIPSYALRDRSTPNIPTKAQIQLAYEWWRKFPDAKLIMSTGDNQGLGIANSTVMAAFARSLGIPQENIIEEDQSLNTHENLLYSMRMMQRKGLKQPTLVTIDLYTRRAVATAKKLGMTNLCWLSVFAEGEPAYGYKWLQTHSRLTIFCYELGATIYSKLVGWT
jgi:uncharacterized SAM-binding protein YcdF (DUF218 family)